MPVQALTFSTPVPDVTLRYLLHVPPALDPAAADRWPLLLFLHGMGERGDDLDLVTVHGPARYIAERADFPFITVMPQCPLLHFWTDFPLPLLLLLDAISDAYPVDRDRVYLTGLSMGGYGTWQLAASYPERFAAIAPVCGGGLKWQGFPERVCNLKRVPVWAFHGALDEAVPLMESALLVKTLQDCGGDAQLTIYPDAGHDSWTATYNNPALYEWLLSHALT